MNRKWKSFKRLALPGVVLALGACGGETPPEEPQFFQGEETIVAPGLRNLRFSLRAGRLYRFDCTPIKMQGCQAQLRDAATWKPIGEPWSSGPEGQHLTFFWRQATAGDVVVDVRSALEQEFGGSFTYELRETRDDAGDAPDQAVPRPVTGPVERFDGFLEHAGDVDGWRFSVPADHTLVADCAGAWASDVKPTIELIRPDGSSLSADRAAWLKSLGTHRLAVKNTGGGDIILSVRASADYGAHSVTYRCRVEDAGVDDLGDTPSEATVVTVPTERSVHIHHVSDVDVLAVDLVEGHAYALTSSARATSPVSTVTTVVNAQATQRWPKLVSNDQGVTFTAPTSGRYFLAIALAQEDGSEKWEGPETFTYKITDVTP
jgi:hypothetical protein